MVRTVDYETRRRAVLSATIKKYVKDALPVASEDIAGYFDLSPATIRKIFVELEEAGYLTHLYTSGGRIPTNKGYRYYVDFLISQMQILENEKEHIIREYQKKIYCLDDVLENTSEIISEITHYAGITSSLNQQDKVFYRGISRVLDQPEFQNLERTRFLIKMIEEKGRLIDIINRDLSKGTKVYIGEEMNCLEMQGCSLVVSAYGFKDKPLGMLAVLGPMRMEYEHIIPILEYISDLLGEVVERF